MQSHFLLLLRYLANEYILYMFQYAMSDSSSLANGSTTLLNLLVIKVTLPYYCRNRQPPPSGLGTASPAYVEARQYAPVTAARRQVWQTENVTDLVERTLNSCLHALCSHYWGPHLETFSGLMSAFSPALFLSSGLVTQGSIKRT